MPGVSGPKPVPGAFGRGEVRLKFVPRKQRRIYGLFIYLAALSVYLFRYLWINHPYVRDFYLLPYIMRPVMVKILKVLITWRNRSQDSAILSMESSMNLTYSQNNVANITCIDQGLEQCLYIQGFVHAKHRMYQMDRLRRTAYGTMAEIYGEKFIDSDIFFRSFDLKSLTSQDLSALSSCERTFLQSYTNGINAYLDIIQDDSYREKSWLSLNWLDNIVHGVNRLDLSLWTPSDTLAVLRLQYLKWGYEEIPMLRDDIPDNYGDHLLPSYASFSVLLSRNWTQSTNAWLISSIDNGESLDSAWHEEIIQFSSSDFYDKFQNESAETFSLEGLTIPGIPLILIGKNNFVAWSITLPTANSSSNLLQLNFPYSDSVDSAARLIYCISSCRFNDSKVMLSESFQASMRHDSISIRYLNGTYSRREISYIDTDHGSIPRYDTPLHTRYALNHGKRQRVKLLSIIQLSKAKTFDNVVNAANSLAAAPIILTYADVYGNIGVVNVAAASNSTGTYFDLPSKERLSELNPSNGYIIISSPVKELSIRLLVSNIKSSTDDLSITEVSNMMMSTHSTSSEVYSLAIRNAINSSNLFDTSCSWEEDSTQISCPKFQLISAKSRSWIFQLLHQFNGDYSAGSFSPLFLDLFRVELSQILDVERFNDYLTTSPLIAKNHRMYLE